MLNKSEILKKLIQEYDVKTTRDVQEMLKDLFAETIQEMLESSLMSYLSDIFIVAKYKDLWSESSDGKTDLDLVSFSKHRL